MIEVELKNTITAGGAKALKQILCNTKLEESTLDMFGGILDIMTCNGELNQSELVSINESQAKVIEKLKGEVEELKEKENGVAIGDFVLMMSDNLKYFIVLDHSPKEVSEADVAKKLRELYFRTEEKRSCDNCYSRDVSCATVACRSGNCYIYWRKRI